MLALLFAFWPSLVFAESPAATATAQHAAAEIANCIAQGPRFGGGYCPTATPSPAPARAATALPSPTAASAITPTDPVPPVLPEQEPAQPCWLTDPELGDPDSGFIVFTEAGEPVPCPDAEATPDAGAEEVPSAEPTPTPTPRPVPIARAVPQPAPLPAATPQVIYVMVPPTDTLVPTVTVTPTPAQTRTPTLTLAPTQTATRVPPSSTPTPPAATATPLPVVAAQDSTPLPPFEWSGVLVVLGVLAATTGAGFLIVRHLRMKHLAQLAELDP
jgi:hypothetical protein